MDTPGLVWKSWKFFTVNVPNLPKNEEYKWVSYDYSWVKKWGIQMRKKDITDEKLP